MWGAAFQRRAQEGDCPARLGGPVTWRDREHTGSAERVPYPTLLTSAVPTRLLLGPWAGVAGAPGQC